MERYSLAGDGLHHRVVGQEHRLDRGLGQRAVGDQTYDLAFTGPVPSEACRALLPRVVRVLRGTANPAARHASVGLVDIARMARFEDHYLTNAAFRECDLTGVRLVGAVMQDAVIDGLVSKLVVNGVEVSSNVEAELRLTGPRIDRAA